MGTDIQFSTAFERITPESAEHGDAESRGFVTLDERISVEEMVDLLDDTEPSVYPLTPDAGRFVWFTRYGDQCPEDGSYTNHSYHPATEADADRMVAIWLDLYRSS